MTKNGFDQTIATVGAAAHNKGLLEGRLAGLAKDDNEKKSYLKGLNKLTTTSKSGWNARSDDWAERMRARQVQVSYVIALARAARKHGLISAGIAARRDRLRNDGASLHRRSHMSK